MAGLDVAEVGNGLSGEDQFQLICFAEHRFGCLGGDERAFRRKGYPVDIGWKWVRAVGFYCNKAALNVQLFYKRRSKLQGRFAAGYHHVARWILLDLADYLFFAHFVEWHVVCVAKGAFQIAAGKADKDGRRSSEETFALQGIENFVDTHGDGWLAGCVLETDGLKARLDIGGDVAFRLLEGDFVAMGHLLGYPVSQIFGSGVEVEKLVEILVVKFALNVLLHVGEVCYHSIFVQCF